MDHQQGLKIYFAYYSLIYDSFFLMSLLHMQCNATHIETLKVSALYTLIYVHSSFANKFVLRQK